MRSRQNGFTLVELMVVVAIVIALGAVAIMTLRTSSSGSGPLGLARQIASELEDMRLRALSTRRWQRLIVNGDSAVHEESESFGMANPTWNDRVVRTLVPNQSTEICGVDTTVHDVIPAGSCMGSLGVEIAFAPDGMLRDATNGAIATPFTIFIQSLGGAEGAKQEYRVVMYRTGMTHVLEGL